MYSKTVLCGNVGGEPDIRSAQSGDKFGSFSLATSEKWKDKQTGETKELTQWHRVQVSGGLCKIVEQYVKKGSKVLVEGTIRYRKYTDKDNVERTATEIRADVIRLLSPRSESGSSSSSGYSSDRPSPSNEGSGRPDFHDDEIPF